MNEPTPIDDVVVLGDIGPPLRLVTGDTAPKTPPVSTVHPVADMSFERRHTSTQWLSLAITLTAIAVITAFIVMFEPPTYLAVAALLVVVVMGSLLIVAEFLTEWANRRPPSDTPVSYDTVDTSTAASMSGGFDVYSLDIDA